MRYLHEFLRFSMAERWLLIKVVLLLEAIKLGMRLLPFRILRRLLALAATAPTKQRHVRRHSAEKLAWVVEVASQHTPGAKTCLTQALAVQVLLARRGHPALLRIGVFRGEGEQFQAHAWVESDKGEVVIGGSELERYTLLAALEGKGLRAAESEV